MSEKQICYLVKNNRTNKKVYFWSDTNLTEVETIHLIDLMDSGQVLDE